MSRGISILIGKEEVTAELLYIGRMDYWVDLLIPWARFGEAYEQQMKR